MDIYSGALHSSYKSSLYQMMGYKENDHPHAAAHYNSTLSLPIYYGLKEQHSHISKAD